MTEYKTKLLNRNNFTVLREAPRPQFNEERSGYILISQQQHQPDQAYHKSFENTPTAIRAGVKLTDAAQGLRELHEKINGALKRSSSATSIRPQQNIYANPLVTALNQTQQKVPRTETTNETMESFYEPRTPMQPSSLYASTIRILPNNISTLSGERVVHFNSQTPQATSTNFYLGGLNQNNRNTEELLKSVKNYQVKTIHNLDSSRKHYTSQNTTQNIPEKVIYAQQPTGASIKLKNFTTQAEFQPGYDKDKLDSVISKIMNAHQNYPSMRQDSFISIPKTTNVTNYESYANSKVYEPRGVLRDNSREIPQQYYHPRPLQTVVNKVPVQMAYKRPITEKKAPLRTEQSLKKSYIGEMQPDGDSMICDFLKENDQLLDFEEEVQPKKKTKEAESESLFVKKVSKRQEIINSKKVRRTEPHQEQPQRQRKEMSYKNNASEVPTGNRRRI